MANYKGIGFDTTNGQNRTGTSSDAVQFTPQLDALNSAAITGDLTVSADCSISGDLDVAGDIISRGAVNLVVEDNFIDLNFGNTTTTSESGGLTISMNRTSGFTSSTVTTFVAGIASTSNPTFTNTDATGSSLLAAGDIVMITGATQQGNNGLYQVGSVNQASFPQVVTIKGTGTTAVDGSLPFCQSQFEAETGASAGACKIDLAVWAVADGSNNFLDDGGANYAKGTFLTAYATSAVLTDFDGNGDYTVATSTLQSAYNGGATIITASSTDIAYTLTSGDFTAAGTGGVLLTPTAASTFTSGGALTLTAGGASTWSSSAGALTLTSAAAATWSTGAGILTLNGAGGLAIAGNAGEIDVTTSGAFDVNVGSVDLDSTAGIAIDGTTLSIDSTDTTNLTMTANAGGSKSLTIAASNSGGGAGSIDMDADGDILVTSVGALDLDGAAVTLDGSAGISLDGTGASSNLSSTGQNLTVSTVTSGTLAVTSAAVLDIDSGTSTDILAATTLTAKGATGASFGDDTGTWEFNGAGVVTETGMASLSVTPSGAITLTAGAASTWSTSAGALTLTSAAAATWSTSAGILTLDGASGVSLAGNAGEIDVTTSAALDLNSGAGTWDSSTLSLDSTDTTNITMTADDASAKIFTIKAKNSNGSGSANLNIDADEINMSASKVGQFSAFAGVSNAAFSKGDVLYMLATSGKIDKSDSDAITTCRVIGVAAKAASAADETIPVVNYGIATVVSDAVVAASKIGNPCYVSLTAGKVTMTPPTAAGDVVYQVGIVTLADGSTAVDVLLQPMFVLENG